ncbi:hypothetical protein [Dinoroseobacter sp. S76]|uniref:hypothetical protein n=1 Tax=Dinoroseobacter sp. S76 TaxID=3415124 RepID=UPI003C7DAC91
MPDAVRLNWMVFGSGKTASLQARHLNSPGRSWVRARARRALWNASTAEPRNKLYCPRTEGVNPRRTQFEIVFRLTPYTIIRSSTE